MKIEGHNTSSVTAETVEAKAEARLLLKENGKLREALQWLVNDLQNHPMSGGLLVAFDNARAALGEKE